MRLNWTGDNPGSSNDLQSGDHLTIHDFGVRRTRSGVTVDWSTTNIPDLTLPQITVFHDSKEHTLTDNTSINKLNGKRASGGGSWTANEGHL
jgi:hypothetical protein